MKERIGYDFERIKEVLEGSLVESVERVPGSSEGFIINVRPFNIKNKHSGASLKVEYWPYDGNTELTIIEKKSSNRYK